MSSIFLVLLKYAEIMASICLEVICVLEYPIMVLYFTMIRFFMKSDPDFSTQKRLD